MNLSPAAFWGLTPREWRWLADAAAPTRLNPETLAALVAAYPDEKK